MSLKTVDIIRFARIFYELTNKKFKLKVVDRQLEYTYDLLMPSEEKVDELTIITLQAAINQVLKEATELNERPQSKDLVPVVKQKLYATSNPYLWSLITKTLQ